jgi:hypothetical protein
MHLDNSIYKKTQNPYNKIKCGSKHKTFKHIMREYNAFHNKKIDLKNYVAICPPTTMIYGLKKKDKSKIFKDKYHIYSLPIRVD